MNCVAKRDGRWDCVIIIFVFKDDGDDIHGYMQDSRFYPGIWRGLPLCCLRSPVGSNEF